MGTQATSLIGQYMPRFSLRQVDRVAVAASPEDTYAAVRAIDLYQLPLVRLLFRLRTLPDRLGARLRGEAPKPDATAFIDDIVRPPSGFFLLGEAAGTEVAVGAVGKFWQPTIEFLSLTPEEFVGFDRPGFGQLAWSIQVAGREPTGAWLTVELRVGATDAVSLARFRRYWHLIGPFSHAIRRGVLRLERQQLGAAGSEEARVLPGDAVLAAPRFQKTHAVTLEAPVRDVWPWLVQMGAGRAGWYSFDWLDNGGVPSADSIVPLLQTLGVGDVLPALPSHPGGFVVFSLDPERSLVLADPSLAPVGPRAGAVPWKTTWAFVLESVGAGATRLTVRVRADYAPGWKMDVLRPVIGLVHEAMERRQLHNLRRRVERTVAGAGRPRTPPPSVSRF